MTRRPSCVITPGAWQDDEPTPAVTSGRVTYESQAAAGLVRGGGPTYVPALPAQPAQRPPVTIDAPAWLAQSQPLGVGAAWAAIDGAREHTSAMDRAKALRVRLAPFLVTWGLIAVAVGVILAMVARQWPAGVIVGILLFAALTAVTYYRLNRTDYEYSREGTEQLKVVTAADLARQQMEHEHELRRMALGAYLATLDRSTQDHTKNGGAR